MKVPLPGAFSDVLPMPRLARNWKRSWILEMMFRWMESQSLWLQLSSRYVWPSNSAVWANGIFLLWGSNESLKVERISGEQKAFSSKEHFYLMAWCVCVYRGTCLIQWPWFSHADLSRQGFLWHLPVPNHPQEEIQWCPHARQPWCLYSAK